LLKLQSFFILKFNSSRLRDCNYKIEKLTLDQARQNNEIIRLGDSELLRKIRRIRNNNFEQKELDDLLRKKKKRKSNSFINEQIDKLLYIEDIITIEFDDSRHYKTIINKGSISINNKNYVRLLAGAGMTRRSTVMFINDEIVDEVKQFLNCDRDLNYKIVPSKFNAYIALASSSSWRVSCPNFVVIPDCEVERLIDVDFLNESDDKTKDPIVSPRKIKSIVNLFDGQGLLSPELNKQWAQELSIDYLPSEWIIRAPYLKGLLATFDFVSFAEKYNINIIKDVYGKEYNIKDINCIISVSQFKLYHAYKDTEDYKNKCLQNDFSWSVSRPSPKDNKTSVNSTYQYLQNLNIATQEQIKELCKKTLDWFKNVTGDDWLYTTLFLLGDVDKERISEEWFDRLDNSLLQSLLLEPKLINDKQIQNKIQRLINKKIKESYLGVLLLEGNYSYMVSDPAAQAEWALGLQIKGLLQEGEHYSKFWVDKEKIKIASIRSPMTYFSELNLLKIKDNQEIKEWYKYLNVGTVFNIFGTDMMRMSGADNDGDLCLTTDQKEFVENFYKNVLPPTYDRKIAEKKIIIESELWEYDIRTFKGRIGLYTNFGTEFFAMLPQFKEGSEEYNEILNRLKICNCLQSMEIDRAKGIQTMDVPKYWTKWEKITGYETPEELHLKELHHRTICDKRPYFFRYLYPNYEKEYKERLDTYNNYCESKFDGDLNYIINKENKNNEEIRIVSNYYRFGGLLDSDCVMNKICHYMESQVKELKKNNSLRSFDFKNIVDNSNGIEYKEKNRLVLENIYQKYKQFRQQINYHSSSSGFQDMMVWLRGQADSIVTSSEEIVYWGSEFGSSFLLDVFGDDLVEVLKKYSNKKFIMPVKSDGGYIDYMGSKYEIVRIDL